MAILTNGVMLAIMYTSSRKIVYRQIQSKVLSIAATAASLINGDLHRDIKTRADETSISYKMLEDRLRHIRDANRRDDVYVKYIYTMTVSPENPNIILFGVDPEESFKDKSHVGDVYKGEYDSPLEIDKNQVDNSFTEDQWGVWLSANAPIKTSSGDAIASLGIDVSASEVLKSFNSILRFGFFALGAAIALAVLISIIVSKWISKPLDALRRTVEAIGNGDLNARTDIKTKDEFGEVGLAINSMAEGLKERKTLKTLFARYVSQQVADNILKSGDMPVLNGHRRKITVLFSDIRNFTQMAEGMSPEDVVKLLNEYFEKMIDVVFRNHGMLDKFIGDGLMVVFGAPLDDLYQEEHAIKTALEMKEELYKLCKKWGTEGRTNIDIGIGINSGNAIVGNIGSTQRLEYTAIGDTVNLAARLESSTKDMDIDILLSEYTYNAVRNIFKTENMGSIQVKGRSDPVTVYSAHGFNSDRVGNA